MGADVCGGRVPLPWLGATPLDLAGEPAPPSSTSRPEVERTADQYFEMKYCWVAFTGELRDGGGTAPVDEEVAGDLSVFLREPTRRLVVNKFVHSPLVSHLGDC